MHSAFKQTVLAISFSVGLSGPALAAGTMEKPAFSITMDNVQYVADVSPQSGGQFLQTEAAADGLAVGDIVEIVDSEDASIKRIATYTGLNGIGLHQYKVFDVK